MAATHKGIADFLTMLRREYQAGRPFTTICHIDERAAFSTPNGNDQHLLGLKGFHLSKAFSDFDLRNLNS